MSDKKQINVTVDEDLYNLVHKFEEVTGMTSTRFVTACILKFLFDGFRNVGLPSHGPAPDFSWVNFAMGLERGQLTVGDVPEAVLKSLVAQDERALRWYNDDSDTPERAAEAEQIKKGIKLTEHWLLSWGMDIREFGGKMGAINNFLEHMLPHGSGIVNPWRT